MRKKRIRYVYLVENIFGNVLSIFSTKKAVRAYCKTLSQARLRDMDVCRYALDTPWVFPNKYMAKRFLAEE